jgi:hypothetical protein
MPAFTIWFRPEDLHAVPHPDALGALAFAPLSASGLAFELVLARCSCCERTYGLWRDVWNRPWGDTFAAALA